MRCTWAISFFESVHYKHIRIKPDQTMIISSVKKSNIGFTISTFNHDTMMLTILPNFIMKIPFCSTRIWHCAFVI